MKYEINLPRSPFPPGSCCVDLIDMVSHPRLGWTELALIELGSRVNKNEISTGLTQINMRAEVYQCGVVIVRLLLILESRRWAQKESYGSGWEQSSWGVLLLHHTSTQTSARLIQSPG